MSTIEQATHIIDLIRSEVTALRALAATISGDATPHRAMPVAGDRAREVAAWVDLGGALHLTWAEMTGAEPLPAVEDDDQAAEVLAEVRAHLGSLRARLDEVVALDETDHHALMQAARRLADRAAAMRLVGVCEGIIGEAREELSLPVLAVARSAAKAREVAVTARLRERVRQEVARRGPGQRRAVADEAGITPATLYAWAPAGE